MAKTNSEEVQIIQDTNALVKARQTEFRANIQTIVNKNMGRLQQILDTCDPKDFCDLLIKLIPYGYARMAEEKTKESPRDVVVEKTILRQKLTED